MHSVAPEEDQASIQVDSEKHKQAEGHRGPAPIPEQLEAALGEAAREGKAKNFEKALIAATRAHFVEPNNPTAMFLTAQAQYGLEDFADALQSFCRCKELLKLDCCSDQTASTASKCDQGIAICTRKISSSRAPADENESTTASLAAPPAFPRTPHLAFSPGVGGDDIVRGSEGVVLNGREVVITEKLDGGNCCFFQGKVYARTHAHETSLPWFSAAKQIAATVAAEGTLPPHTALFLENMEAVHSIDYGHLPSPVFVIAALRLDAPTPTLFAWDDLCALARSLGLPTPPVLHRGSGVQEVWLEEWAQQQQLAPSLLAARAAPSEGFVVREVRRPALLFFLSHGELASLRAWRTCRSSSKRAAAHRTCLLT
mmetsp:Transcript_42834/g.101133  ORF Transcript_42834/g.101133 Transcript_42834/m.101133 type:complete len:371 (-) Transcript_42834:276-1388(-)